ncbi:GDP-mannose 4,6-dehydratase [Porticoccaceae bacterium]|nr:GDP-mannose 4,6-dehydratase [Porticoccaceae bacterium]
MVGPFRVLITGIDGFTGQYIINALSNYNYQCFGLKSDLRDRQAVTDEVIGINPHYVIHLAAISFSAELDFSKIYDVNVVGSINLLDALIELENPPKKVIIASSAAIYGNCGVSCLEESLSPAPVSHYACSKLSMEFMSQNYFKKLPIIITRPFNYTGVGHDEKFLIPKIIRAYKDEKKELELGNLDISREFNDVRDICVIYQKLLDSKLEHGVVNLCSGNTVSLMEIIEMMNDISGYKMNISVNPKFVRSNEIKVLSGSTVKLKSHIQVSFKYSLPDTLNWMYVSGS